MRRLLIVSSRLPVAARVEDGALRVEPSSGGLAADLAGPPEESERLWIGWIGLPGEVEAARRDELAPLLSPLRVVPVPIPAAEIERYYDGACDGIIWPLFHYQVCSLSLEFRDLDVYEHVNQRFADAVVAAYQPGDLVWVHDYPLMLVPGMLRRRLPSARIGFFLHIPFPSSELLRVLPGRERFLEGLLGADLVGFHTASYMRHFSSSVLRVLGMATELDRIEWRGRRVRVGVFPMGVDGAACARLAETPEVQEQVAAVRAGADTPVLVGIDRLDDSKGIARCLLAFERLLRDHPELRGSVRLVQVAVPSRMTVEACRELRESLEGVIGRIHGTFATPTWSPVRFLCRRLSASDVTALYRAADVMLATPIRDGMNLTAKEFVASRTDEDGVLVLSEFAGSANELAEALLVNPYDIERTADAFHQALVMPVSERRARMRGLRRRVLGHDVHAWARDFLERLAVAGGREEPRPPADPITLAAALGGGVSLVVFVDYDGTLVPFAPTPDLALPDAPLLALLRRLAERPGAEVHIVSGRLRDTLATWLGDLPVWLHAEHGAWSRAPGKNAWTALAVPPTPWRAAVRRILAEFAARTPGSLVEEKASSLAWHYRMADPEFGASRANELALHLWEVLSDEPVEILRGAKVIEVRPHGLHKGRLVPGVLAHAADGTRIVALGDDRTDEDLFAALPEGAMVIRVGPRARGADLRLADVGDVRMFLDALAATPTGSAA